MCDRQTNGRTTHIDAILLSPIVAGQLITSKYGTKEDMLRTGSSEVWLVLSIMSEPILANELSVNAVNDEIIQLQIETAICRLSNIKLSNYLRLDLYDIRLPPTCNTLVGAVTLYTRYYVIAISFIRVQV